MNSIDIKKTIRIEQALGIYANDVRIQKMFENLYSDDGKEERPGDWGTTKSTFSHLFEKQQGFVAFDKEDYPVGYSLWMETPNSPWVPESIFISELYVSLRFRNHGIGTHLIQRILEQSFPDGIKKFWITHDPEHKTLTTFYQRLGFTATGMTDVGNVIMTREI